MTTAVKDKTQKQELIDLASRHGGTVTPEQVVEFAADPSTALHTFFEWDDSEAARKYRLEQARSAIRAVVTVLPNSSGPTRTVRVFACLSTEREGDGATPYRLMADVMRDDDMRATLIADAQRELKAARQKHGHLSELAKVWNAIDEFT